MKPSISIVIPAYNEEGNLELAVQSVIRGLADRFSSYEIIVVNDASQDQTGSLAERLAKENSHVRVVHHPVNKGMGQSLSTGFKAAKMDFVGSFPGDNGFDVDSWGTMLDLIGKADVVSYYIANPEFRPWPRRLISWIFVGSLNTVFGLSIRYYNGHAVYRRESIQKLKHISNGHTFLAECLIRLVKDGHSHLEVGTIQIERQFGETKAFAFKNFREVLKFFIKLPIELHREKANRK